MRKPVNSPAIPMANSTSSLLISKFIPVSPPFIITKSRAKRWAILRHLQMRSFMHYFLSPPSSDKSTFDCRACTCSLRDLNSSSLPLGGIGTPSRVQGLLIWEVSRIHVHPLTQSSWEIQFQIFLSRFLKRILEIFQMDSSITRLNLMIEITLSNGATRSLGHSLHVGPSVTLEELEGHYKEAIENFAAQSASGEDIMGLQGKALISNITSAPNPSAIPFSSAGV
uniref:Uncharacterized protein n=2 Tax=Glomeraceae TaxID=36751 RepID=X5GZC5_9GLOM|nr:hypothetical protein [Glomus sp. DAOM 229456]AHX00141.1 hypothetical protein [Rhizophagus irregularis]